MNSAFSYDVMLNLPMEGGKEGHTNFLALHVYRIGKEFEMFQEV